MLVVKADRAGRRSWFSRNVYKGTTGSNEVFSFLRITQSTSGTWT